MKITKIGTVGFGKYGLEFNGWVVEGGTQREFQIDAINLVARNYFVKLAMFSEMASTHNAVINCGRE